MTIEDWLMVQEKPRTIDPEELETVLEDLDFMVEIVRQNCGIVSFLSVAHSATILRRLFQKHKV